MAQAPIRTCVKVQTVSQLPELDEELDEELNEELLIHVRRQAEEVQR